MITHEDRKLLVEFMGREITQDSDLEDLEHSLPVEFVWEVIKKIQGLGYYVAIHMRNDVNTVTFYDKEGYTAKHKDFSTAAALAALQIIRLNNTEL